MYQIKVPMGTITPRSENQKQYIKTIADNIITFGLGPAGTGKTFIAVAVAVEMLMNRSSVERIIIARPAIEAGENLGFLPGDMTDKVDPYMRPIFDALYDCMGTHMADEYMDSLAIEIAPLAFMRGRTFKDAVVILDEAQNATTMQMKMFLTRIGDNCRVIVCGDESQSDLDPAVVGSGKFGLTHAAKILEGKKAIGITRFCEEDVVRHPVVRTVLKAYSGEDKF